MLAASTPAPAFTAGTSLHLRPASAATLPSKMTAMLSPAVHMRAHTTDPLSSTNAGKKPPPRSPSPHQLPHSPGWKPIACYFWPLSYLQAFLITCRCLFLPPTPFAAISIGLWRTTPPNISAVDKCFFPLHFHHLPFHWSLRYNTSVPYHQNASCHSQFSAKSKWTADRLLAQGHHPQLPPPLPLLLSLPMVSTACLGCAVDLLPSCKRKPQLAHPHLEPPPWTS